MHMGTAHSARLDQTADLDSDSRPQLESDRLTKVQRGGGRNSGHVLPGANTPRRTPLTSPAPNLTQLALGGAVEVEPGGVVERGVDDHERVGAGQAARQGVT